MLAVSTSLECLDDIIHGRPTDIALLLKDDLTGAAADLTESLAITRSIANQYRALLTQTGFLTEDSRVHALNSSRGCHTDSNVQQDNQLSSLESQLLFQRAGVYLALACQGISSYLDSLKPPTKAHVVSESARYHAQPHGTLPSAQVRSQGLEARKLTRLYVKRALRDYVNFLSFFEYTPGTPADVVKHYEHRSGEVTARPGQPGTTPKGKNLENANRRTLDEASPSCTMMSYELEAGNSQSGCAASGARSVSPPLNVFRTLNFFAATPPTDLPPYPITSREIVKVGSRHCLDSTSDVLSADKNALTFHPLFIESLHSLSLCHSLVQTSPKDHLRHVHMVARLTRICDGYPIFLAARSLSRSDWVEVARQADNWIGLEQSWDSLCAPAALAKEQKEHQKEETQAQARERIRQQAIMGSLADERVIDDTTFQSAVASRQRRAQTSGGNLHPAEQGGDVSKRSPQADTNDSRAAASERRLLQGG
ncbi:MAG: hypothetical protein LQ338_004348 [Usnochroma carphineum]|nr:MAG: hypothetical protein LQ338_004348 [Usnochroma carphineum]